MEESIHNLPPSKRFKLLQPQEDHSKPYHTPNCLPAKKRIDSRHQYLPTSLCLPAKKRIWAPHSLSPIKLQEDDEPFGKPTVEEKEEEDDDGIICAVCHSTDGDPMDPIVFCDGCDLTVHASCYGNPLIKSIPEGDWFCLRCEGKEEEGNADCCLCPMKGGAVKPTTDGRWAHILCALLVPEVFFQDPEGRDGVDCSKVPIERRKVECYLCGCKSGCAIDCSEPRCGLRFHVSCGLEEELCIEYKEGKGGGIVAGFCRDHTQLWKKQQLTGKFKIVPRETDSKKKEKD